MAPTQQGSIRLFQFGGIQVYLHWSWFIIALVEFNNRTNAYRSLVWNALEYLTLFGIVLVHEFGHSLACRQVGGRADRIVLWPLGGVAYVSPPQRPGAMLWSIAAGPLVNVVLAPILIVTLVLARQAGLIATAHDAYLFLRAICYINIGLLIFNLLPIYPLDGGQILRSLLWFIFGRARSLMITAIVGIVGVVGLIALAVAFRSIWMGIIAAFILLNCWGGLMQARMLGRVAKLPRRGGFACPSCHQPPPLGPLWRCAKCFKPFDTFESHAVCPHCGAAFPVTQCLDCGEARPLSEWNAPPPVISSS
ncbi:MAG TPA: M50 family metallopeptidase [Verrucomicrobiae bacterium]